MTRPYSKHRPGRSRRSDSGVFLLIIAGIFFALLAIVGVAIDAGNLYRSRLRLQKAVDAGAMAGTYLLGGTLTTATIRGIAQGVTRANMDQMGLKSPPGDPPVVNPSSTEVSVEGTAEVPLIFLRLIPGFKGSHIVTASARALTTRTIVSLVLDTTGSMNCPLTGACTGGIAHPSKLDKLKEAAVSFVNIFDESLDQVALITFSDRATVRKTMLSPFNKAQLTNSATGIIPNLTATGQTNIESGIAAARNEILSSNLTGAKKVLVLVTDGAPNVLDVNAPGADPCQGIVMYDPATGYVDARRHYLKAIQAADAAREDGITVYTVGLGNIPTGVNPGDAFQNIANSTDLKSILLKRITNAEGAATDPNFEPYGCVPTYLSYNSTPGRSAGTYLQTPNANDLQSLLVSIGRSIKARLVS